MSESFYERHFYKDPGLPFLCHCDTVEAPGTVELHWHEHVEFLCGIWGEAYIGARRYILEKGSLVTVNTGEPHNVYTESGANYNCLIVNVSFLRENGIDPDIIHFSPSVYDPEACRLHFEACAAFRENGDLRIVKTRHAVLSFLLYLCEKHMELRIGSEDNSCDAVKKSLSYIRRHFSEHISLDDAAESAGLSRYYFSRKFKEITGQSFILYLNSLRCEKAMELLRTGNSVTDVCFSCGFTDPAYFSRIFRQITGQAPSAFRP